MEFFPHLFTSCHLNCEVALSHTKPNMQTPYRSVLDSTHCCSIPLGLHVISSNSTANNNNYNNNIQFSWFSLATILSILGERTPNTLLIHIHEYSTIGSFEVWNTFIFFSFVCSVGVFVYANTIFLIFSFKKTEISSCFFLVLFLLVSFSASKIPLLKC